MILWPVRLSFCSFNCRLAHILVMDAKNYLAGQLANHSMFARNARLKKKYGGIFDEIYREQGSDGLGKLKFLCFTSLRWWMK